MPNSKKKSSARLTFRPIVVNGRPVGAFTSGGAWQPAPHGAPSSLTVWGERWAVAYHTRLYASRSRGSSLFGFANHLERVIVVDPSQPPAEMRSTLTHEALHCALAVGRAMDERVGRISKETEEALCCVLERALGGMVWG